MRIVAGDYKGIKIYEPLDKKNKTFKRFNQRVYF